MNIAGIQAVCETGHLP